MGGMSKGKYWPYISASITTSWWEGLLSFKVLLHVWVLIIHKIGAKRAEIFSWNTKLSELAILKIQYPITSNAFWYCFYDVTYYHNLDFFITIHMFTQICWNYKRMVCLTVYGWFLQLEPWLKKKLFYYKINICAYG